MLQTSIHPVGEGLERLRDSNLVWCSWFHQLSQLIGQLSELSGNLLPHVRQRGRRRQTPAGLHHRLEQRFAVCTSSTVVTTSYANRPVAARWR